MSVADGDDVQVAFQAQRLVGAGGDLGSPGLADQLQQFLFLRLQRCPVGLVMQYAV